MAEKAGDHALLLGLLALEAGWLGRDELVHAVARWIPDRSRPFDDVLVADGHLTDSQRQLAHELVREHLAAHGHDPHRCLAALNSLAALREQLWAVGDRELQATLERLGRPAEPAPPEEAPDTRPPADHETPATGPRFRALRPLGEGGLGRVFIAHDEELHREVALKEIQPRHADEPTSRARFLREAEITGRLEHPNIVPIYALGRYLDGRPYYAMRLIQGETLLEALARYHARGRQALELRQLLRRFVDVCNAIAYAHSKGILHRDLKPGNVLLGAYGETLVVDWGLARQLDGTPPGQAADTQPPGASEPPPAGATQPGQVLGTPQYMSPEQAAGLELGPASDVYSLGATLAHLLGGQAPFEGADPAAVLAQVRRGEFVPPRQRVASVPRALEAIALTAMAHNPADRYSSARALADDVERWLADEAVTVHRESLPQRLGRWSRRHRAWTRAGAAALVLVAAVAAAAALTVEESRRAEGRERQHAEELAASLVREKDATEQQRRQAVLRLADNSFSRGLELCQRHDVARGLHWMVRALDVLPRDTTGADELEFLLRRNLSAWERGLHAWPLPLGFPRTVARAVFAPDGRTLLAADEHGLVRLHDTRDGALRASFRPDSGPQGLSAFLRLGSDARTVLVRQKTFLVQGQLAGRMQLYDAATGKALPGKTVDLVGFVSDARFSPDGGTIAFLAGRRVHLWDRGSNRVEGIDHPANVTQVAFGTQGRLAVGCQNGSVHLWDLATRRALMTPLRLKGEIKALALAGEERLLAAAGLIAHLWDLKAGKEKFQFRHDWIITAADVTADGLTILTGSQDQTARLWNGYNGRQTHVLKHLNALAAVALRPDGQVALTGDWNGVARLWDVRTGEPLGAPWQRRGPVYAVGFDGAGGQAFIAGGLSHIDAARCFGEVCLLRLLQSGTTTEELLPAKEGGKFILERTLQQLDTVPTTRAAVVRRKIVALWEGDKVRRVALANAPPLDLMRVSPDGKLLATTHTDFANGHEVRLWSLATGTAIGGPLTHPSKITSLTFHPREATLVTGCGDGGLRFWDAATATARPLRLQLKFPMDVHGLRFSASGKVLLGEGVGIHLWAYPGGRPLVPPIEVSGQAVRGVLAADGRAFVAPVGEGETLLWPLPEKPAEKLAAPLRLRHQGRVGVMAFSPDGQALLTAGSDYTARLWQRATGRSLGPPLPHPDAVTLAEFSPDGRTLLTGCKDGRLRLWDRTTGRPLGPPFGNVVRVLPDDSPPRFSADGSSVLALPLDRRVHVWPVPRACAGSAAQLRARVELRTGRELDAGDNLRVLTPTAWQQRLQRAGVAGP